MSIYSTHSSYFLQVQLILKSDAVLRGFFLVSAFCNFLRFRSFCFSDYGLALLCIFCDILNRIQQSRQFICSIDHSESHKNLNQLRDIYSRLQKGWHCQILPALKIQLTTYENGVLGVLFGLLEKSWQSLASCSSCPSTLFLFRQLEGNFVRCRHFLLSLLARDYLQLVKMVGKFIGHCLNFPTIYTGKQ